MQRELCEFADAQKLLFHSRTYLQIRSFGSTKY